jgi:hypothetical protein
MIEAAQQSRREVVALDKMEEITAAAPDRPVGDPGTAVGLEQVVGNLLMKEVVVGLAAGLEHRVQSDVGHQTGVGASSRSRR